MLPGTYKTTKKDGSIYYKASITYLKHHISLGSYSTEKQAHKAYDRANKLLNTPPNSKPYTYTIDNYSKFGRALPFDKWVMLINLRDNKMYLKTPIYLKKSYFLYYLDQHTPLKFDADDLFYYSNHKIMRRGGHLFVADYGMQVNILSRYGIKNFAVPGRDYLFVNGDNLDFRYANIQIINKYHGVLTEETNPLSKIHKKPYLAKIHINGDTIIGRYLTQNEAAIAFNKAADLVEDLGLNKNFPRNYIEPLTKDEYQRIYDKIKISDKVIQVAKKGLKLC